MNEISNILSDTYHNIFRFGSRRENFPGDQPSLNCSRLGTLNYRVVMGYDVITALKRVVTRKNTFLVDCLILTFKRLVPQLMQHCIRPFWSTIILAWKQVLPLARVGCDNATGHITRHDLEVDRSFLMRPYAKLKGSELNSCLTELSHLSYMDLSGTYFGGSPIPEFIGSLTQLRYLILYSAGFSGMVLHFIGNLSNLRVLDLGDMDLLVVDDFTWF
uniref:Uncharacterized protein n=1 Tax=Lactuca sativa TaxID=4236 RepID=A0A9R1VNT1_LACSA|nr:hypothetical protein LSAT_V11C500262110 [Lactuca sativa]